MNHPRSRAAGINPLSVIPAQAGLQTRESRYQLKAEMTREKHRRAAGNWTRRKIEKMNKGFTLIELLVVIAIIGLLSSIVLASLNNARVKARDARRQTDLNQIYLALQLFFDTNGYLPITSSYGEANSGGWDYSSQGQFLPFLQTGGQFSVIPVDPLNNGTGDVFYGGSGYAYAYYCYSSENSLALGARLESGGVIWKANHEMGYRCQ